MGQSFFVVITMPTGYYPEHAEKDPRAPWNDESPDYWCNNCEWTSKHKEPILVMEV
jgi:hypothetical protein